MAAFDPTPYRAHFPALANLLFLNHAGVAPVSRPCAEAMGAMIEDSLAWGSVHEGTTWADAHRRARASFARLIGASANEVAFVKNTSEGLGHVAEGLAWKEGDNVVWLEGEYPSNVYPWMHLARRGVEARMVRARDGGAFSVDDILASVDKRTRLLSVSSVEFSTGFRNDLDKLGGACRERGVLFCVDAIQSLGALALDVSRTPVDFLSADAHKWMVGPEGVGGFYAREAALDLLTPTHVGWKSVERPLDFSRIDFTLKKTAAKFEAGSLPTILLAGFGASLDLLLEVGVGRIESHLLALTGWFAEALLRRGFAVAGSRKEGETSGIVSFEGKADAQALYDGLRVRGIAAALRGGRIRVSPHFYNTREDLERVLAALDEIARRA